MEFRKYSLSDKSDSHLYYLATKRKTMVLFQNKSVVKCIQNIIADIPSQCGLHKQIFTFGFSFRIESRWCNFSKENFNLYFPATI